MEIQWVCIGIHLLMMVSRVVLLGHKRKKRKARRINDPPFFCLHPFLSASWIQYLQIVAD
jgi:hypothetical protein